MFLTLFARRSIFWTFSTPYKASRVLDTFGCPVDLVHTSLHDVDFLDLFQSRTKQAEYQTLGVLWINYSVRSRSRKETAPVGPTVAQPGTRGPPWRGWTRGWRRCRRSMPRRRPGRRWLFAPLHGAPLSGAPFNEPGGGGGAPSLPLCLPQGGGSTAPHEPRQCTVTHGAAAVRRFS